MSGRYKRFFVLIIATILISSSPTWAQEKEVSDTEQLEAVELPKMVVTGSREATDDPDKLPVPVQIITKEEIEDIGAITLGQVLEVTQGVDLVTSPDLNISPGFQTLRMRGMDINHTLILVDGKRLSGSYPTNQGYSFPDISTINIDMIERIEILRDGASAQYGSDAVAGVINIVTKRYVKKFSVNSQYGDSSEGDGDERHVDASGGFPLGERLYCNIGAFRKERDHFDRTLSKRWDSPDFEQKGGNGSISLDLTDHQILDLDFRYAQTNSDFQKDEIAHRITDKKTLHSGLLWKGEFERLRFELGADHTNQDTERRHSEDPTYNGDIGWDVTESHGNVSWDVTHYLSFFTGASWNKEDVDSPQRNFVESRRVKAVFGEIGLKPINKLKFQLSGRFEDYSDFGDNFAPKLAARYEIIHPLSVRASVSESYQVPTLFQLHDRFIGAMGWNDIYGNPNLVPSKGMNTTCGLVWKISEEYKARISVDLFYNRIEDMIETVVTKKKTATENAETTYKNIEGTSKFKGIEVSLSTDIPYGFGIDIGGDYLDAKDPDGHDLKNRPRSGLVATLRYKYRDRFWGNLRYNYRGKYISDLNEKIEYFDIINAQINYKIADKVTIFLGGRNLLDEEPPLNPELYETGHIQGAIDSWEGAFYYTGLRWRF